MSWRCFFCDETFTDESAAREHFGSDIISMPGCQIKVGEEQGLLKEVRRLEEELARYRVEDSDMERQIHAQAARHDQALRDAEQSGYDKGLADGRTMQ